MSTSFSPALEREVKPEIHPFPYTETAELGGSGESHAANSPDRNAELAKREQAAREAGQREGEARARSAFEGELTRSRDIVREAIEDFSRERTRYYQKVEIEVVQLALSIARKILHREAQLDPLLLAGVVRVALDQIESRTKVVIRVNPVQAADCRGYFARSMDPDKVPEVIEDPALEADRCVLQTELGTTELGIEVQLKEIERGLLDLLAQRPGQGV